jgi:hypothetical protein
MSDIPTLLDIQVYEDLRKRLVDLTRRNRLLHFVHGARSPIIRVVDEAFDAVIDKLQRAGKFRFRSLPDPDDEPADERTAAFRAALSAARVTDQIYRDGIASLDPEDPSTTAKEVRIERELRDRVRAQLGLRPRSARRSLDQLAWARQHGVEPALELAAAVEPLPTKHSDDWLQTLLYPDQLQAKLTSVHRKALSVEQETGVNTLHLAFGFIDWFESDASDQVFSSPLLLMPVALQRNQRRGGEEEYRLVALDDAPITNLSLELRLREDFKLTLPAFDPEAARPIEEYFTAVAQAIERFRRWRIRRFLTLATFSFARMAMYRDLDRNNWKSIRDPTQHSLIKPILHGSGSTSSEASDFAVEYEIDDPHVEAIAPILVHDADSSQHSAIIDAMKGRNVVIEGPPGTGKSQTIANLIANALHAGGTVLFVSEKMAALDVVKSRLDAVGLGHFCLTLHAAGAKPTAVIEALKERAALGRHDATVVTPADSTVHWARSEIGAHLNTFHSRVGPFGETIHRLIGKISELGRRFPEFPPGLFNALYMKGQRLSPHCNS